MFILNVLWYDILSIYSKYLFSMIYVSNFNFYIEFKLTFLFLNVLIIILD